MAVVNFYDENGNLYLGLQHRIFRVLKIVTPGTSDGSTTVPGLEQGTMLVATGSAEGYKPKFSQNGNQVNWTFNGVPQNQRANVGSALIAVY